MFRTDAHTEFEHIRVGRAESGRLEEANTHAHIHVVRTESGRLGALASTAWFFFRVGFWLARVGGLLHRGPSRGVDAPSLGRGQVVSSKRPNRGPGPGAPRVVRLRCVARRPSPVSRAARAPRVPRPRPRPRPLRHAMAGQHPHRETVVAGRGPSRSPHDRNDARNLPLGVRGFTAINYDGRGPDILLGLDYGLPARQMLSI